MFNTIPIEAKRSNNGVIMNLPALHQSIVDNHYEQFVGLIEQGADVNQLDPVMGNAPLHIAAQQSSTQWVSKLLESGAFINLQTPKHGVTPLMVAVWHRKPDIVKVLLAQPDVNTEIVSTFGAKAAQLVDFGASRGDVFGQQQAKDMGDIFADYQQTFAAKQAQLSAYQVVTDMQSSDEQMAAALDALQDWSTLNVASPVNASGNDEHTAVMVAARDGHTQSLRILMEKGGDQTIPDHYMKAIPLHKAAYNGRSDVIRLLANYAGFNETLNAQGPNNGYTPLHDAVWHGHTDSAKALIEAGAELELKGFDGKTPLDLAKEYHYAEIVELLENK